MNPPDDLDMLLSILGELDRKAVKAAKTNKPTMWAYYQRMRGRLAEELGQATRGGGIAGAALAVVQKADSDCPHLEPSEAADLWALSVYCVRIMRAWGLKVDHRQRDLSWLRNRALLLEIILTTNMTVGAL